MPSSTFTRELVSTADTKRCWGVLTDVPRLVSWVSIVSDAQELARLEKYTAVLMDRLGPFKLRADLDIRVSEVEDARHIRVRAAGEDRQVSSRIGVDASLTLEPTADGGTRVVVDGSYEVVGRVATMGAGTIRKKADKILTEFFEHAARDLGGDG